MNRYNSAYDIIFCPIIYYFYLFIDHELYWSSTIYLETSKRDTEFRKDIWNKILSICIQWRTFDFFVVQLKLLVMSSHSFQSCELIVHLHMLEKKLGHDNLRNRNLLPSLSVEKRKLSYYRISFIRYFLTAPSKTFRWNHALIPTLFLFMDVLVIVRSYKKNEAIIDDQYIWIP